MENEEICRHVWILIKNLIKCNVKEVCKIKELNYLNRIEKIWINTKSFYWNDN